MVVLPKIFTLPVAPASTDASPVSATPGKANPDQILNAFLRLVGKTAPAPSGGASAPAPPKPQASSLGFFSPIGVIGAVTAPSPTTDIAGLEKAIYGPPALAADQAGQRVKAFIKTHPGQAGVDALADAYRHTAGSDTTHRTLLGAALKSAGVDGAVAVTLDTLAMKYPDDPDLHARYDAQGNQTGLSASEQLRGADLPSDLPQKQAFISAIDSLSEPDVQSTLDRLGTGGHSDPLASDWQFPRQSLATMATMTPDDPRWDGGPGGATVPTYKRQRMIDAAQTALKPESMQFLDQVDNGSGTITSDRMNAWLAKAHKTGRTTDGKVEDFGQGQVGDCFLLSGIDALSKTDSGQEIIANSISHSDGMSQVQFAGDPNHTVFTVSDQEVAAARKAGKCSQGDADVSVLELAYEKYDQQFGKTSQKGGQPADVLALLTGDRAKVMQAGSPTQLASELDRIASNPDGFSMTVGAGVDRQGNPVPFMDPNSVGAHAFVVTAVDADAGTITLQNPWNTSTPHVMNLQDFCEMQQERGASISYLDDKQASAGVFSQASTSPV